MSIALHQRVDALERQVAELIAAVERLQQVPRKIEADVQEAPVRTLHLKERPRG